DLRDADVLRVDAADARDGGPESTRAIAEMELDLARVRVDAHDVQLAVAVQIGGGHISGIPDKDTGPAVETSGPASPVDADCTGIAERACEGDGEVQVTVAIEVTHGESAIPSSV